MLLILVTLHIGAVITYELLVIECSETWFFVSRAASDVVKHSVSGFRLLKVLAMILPCGYGLMLAWQEWQFRQGQAAVLRAPVPVNTVQVPAPLNTLAVATVLGLTAHGSLLNSAEPLTLRATLIASDGESRALLAGPESERFYRAGERLPGGSLLRRVEPAHVVLWRQGREEVLRLRPVGERFLQVLESPLAEALPDPSARHLRPMAEQPRSD